MTSQEADAIAADAVKRFRSLVSQDDDVLRAIIGDVIRSVVQVDGEKGIKITTGDEIQFVLPRIPSERRDWLIRGEW